MMWRLSDGKKHVRDVTFVDDTGDEVAARVR